MLYDREIRNKLTGLWKRLHNAQKKYETKENTEKEYIKKLDDIKLLAHKLNIQCNGDKLDYNNLLNTINERIFISLLRS